MRIGILGSGYVGLVTGVCLASTGNEITCYDVDYSKIKKLSQGSCPFYEPGLKDLLESNIKEKRLFFTTDLSKVIQHNDVLMITVGTPSDDNGNADLSAVYEIADHLGETLKSPKLIVQKSTVPVGTAAEVESRINEKLEARKVNFRIEVASNPEFLKEGDAVRDFKEPDRIILGVNSQTAKEVLEFLYYPFMKRGYKVISMRRESAELSKYTANAMLASRISLINGVARLAEQKGANIEEVREGVGSDSRIGRAFLYPGVGYGGSCFPKDVRALMAQANGVVPEFSSLLGSIEKVNQEQVRFLLRKIFKRFEHKMKDRVIGIWGLSFKAGTDDTRGSPAFTVVKELLSAEAHTIVYDPAAMDNFYHQIVGGPKLKCARDQYEAAKKAEALLILTDWMQFRTPDLEKLKETMQSPIIFDGRNLLEPMTMQQGGFEYYDVGRMPVS